MSGWGRGAALKSSYDRWTAGYPAEAAAALPDEVIDELWVYGSPDECRRRISRYLHPRVTTIVLYIAPTPEIAADPEGLPSLLAQLVP